MEAVGHTVHVVCSGKKAGELIKTSLHDFEGNQTYTEKPGHLFALNKTLPRWRPLTTIVREFHDAKKPIFTICHGVQVLIAVEGVMTGKRVAALQYCEPEVRLAGGIYVDVPPDGAISDGELVSAKGWPGVAAFMRECLKVLGTEIRHS